VLPGSVCSVIKFPNQGLYLPRAGMVHTRSQSVIYRGQIAHAYQWHINEELHGCFFVNVAATT